MDKNLIWAIKASGIFTVRKKLEELAEKEDLFDEASIDTGSKEYKMAVRNFNRAYELGYSVVTYLDEDYPQALRRIAMPPAVLYVRGNVAALNNVLYAGIVGSRKCDVYGTQTASSIAYSIGEIGAGVISGGAEGVDAAAHEGALRAKAPTIAVLGCGLDIDYPKKNRELFSRIEESGGAVMSEFPFGKSPTKKTFPFRNRIIAAMSEAVVVVRAGKRSGALITASQALDMNKSVFAVPGNINSPLSAGTNELIRDGAVPLLSTMDIIDGLIEARPDYFVREKEEKALEIKKSIPTEERKSSLRPNLSEYESEILDIIESGSTTQALIEEKISFEISRLTALLVMLELKGVIKKKADKSYIII